MLFTELEFIYFFLPVFVVFAFLNFRGWKKAKNVFLLVASYVFYGMFSPTYLVSLIYVSAISWAYTMKFADRRSKLWLSITIILSLLPLAFYKYAHFIVQDCLLLQDRWFGDIILPVGISFFTFQALTHMIDSYRGKVESRISFVEFFLFVSFFPTVLSGPIERSRTLVPQIRSLQRITLGGVLNGLQLFVWGLFKKLVVANRIALYVNDIYGNPEMYGGNTILLAISLYSIQIYCDFSGYSDMAIGIGRMIGFDLCKNFDYPYFSTSIRQFWRKWHISLTSWLTEYLYISLGGNRVKEWRWVVNVLIVFLVSGIWHGAAWTFIIWGVIHGCLQIIEHYTLGRREFAIPIVKFVQGVVLFALVSFAWVFFRASDIRHAVLIIGNSLSMWEPLHKGASMTSFLIMMAGVFMLILFEVLLKKRIITITESDDNPLRCTNMVFMVFVVLTVELLSQTGAGFVYFQF